MDIYDLSLFRRILCSLSPHIRLASHPRRQYPIVVGESSDVPLDQCWVVRPQLFFLCHLRSRGARLQRRPNYTYGPDDIHVQLVFYSTFEPMILPGGGPMEAMGVQKLYKPSPTPLCMWASPPMCWGACP